MLAESEFLSTCEQGMEELVKGLPEIVEAFAELKEAFTAPPCTDLVDGQPIPSKFLEEGGEFSDLECELDDVFLSSYSFSGDLCEATGRYYYSNDYGWAYQDDKIFHLGEVPDSCSYWYVPPCSDLIDGQPVSAKFFDTYGELYKLDCVLNGTVIYSFWSEQCEATGRYYYSNDYGWAYQDDKIFHLGEVPDNCSSW
jgi:hypothetical protein